MLVTRRSLISNKEHSIDIPISKEELHRLDNRKELIQNILPNMSNVFREFLKSGITPEEQKTIFNEKE